MEGPIKRLPRLLDPVEVRILGALLEKQQTTPDYYPLTVNALLAACNQKSNRDPVMELSETEVWDALDRLKEDVLVWKVSGGRAEHFEQNLDRRWSLNGAKKALMTVLLLRGPQTPGELRARTGRMHEFTSVEQVEETLHDLAAGDQPLVAELSRTPGQKESRWAHLAGGEPPAPVAAVSPVRTAVSAVAAPRPAAEPREGLADRVASLEEQVEALTRELAELKSQLGA